MGTKWGPSTAEMGTQKAYISKLTETSKFIEEASFFLNKKYSQRQSVSSFSAQCLCHLHWIIKWSILDGGCTEFSRILKPEIEKMGTLNTIGDPMGTQNLKKVPMGTRVPKWGPTWEQCDWPDSEDERKVLQIPIICILSSSCSLLQWFSKLTYLPRDKSIDEKGGEIYVAHYCPPKISLERLLSRNKAARSTPFIYTSLSF